MTFKWECLRYEMIYGKEVNKPVAIVAIYKDGNKEKKVLVPFESRHLDQAIFNLQEKLGRPQADLSIDDF